ncbi:MAG: RNA-binding protein [Candidatus Heimdallarchaeota archaeon]|nr:RNA-binding protein [Candidatus Heimdallarchaeota archaeon]HUU78287.1 zinc finger domain-containing protein [candidate division Zixibacteria bacterium]
MSETYTMPSCSCCFRKISPDDIGSVKFRCPNCGDVVQIRCSKCRQMENHYICPACGFEGP